MAENKFIDSIFKDKLIDLAKSDRFISDMKLEIAYKEFIADLNKQGKNLTEEQEKRIHDSMYQNLENAFIKELKRAFDKLSYQLYKGEFDEFVDKIKSIYDKYCSENYLLSRSNEPDYDKLAQDSAKKDRFIGGVIVLCNQYRSKELITDRINMLIAKYGTDDLCDYVEKMTKLLGLADYETKGILDHIKGVQFNPYSVERVPAIFSMYQIYKSEDYNEKMSKDEYGYIDLDDYAYINAKRRASNIGINGSWIISSNLESFFAKKLSHHETSRDKIFRVLTDSLRREYGDYYLERFSRNKDPNQKEADEDDRKYEKLKVISKKIYETLQEPISVGSVELSEEVMQKLDPITDKLSVVLNDPKTNYEMQLAALKRVDDVTPTETSEEDIQRIINELNDPTVSISPEQIVLELATENIEESSDREKNKIDRLEYLIAKLSEEICSIMNIKSQYDIEEVTITVYNAIMGTDVDMIEKNNFFIPQLAKQLGIDATVYYKAAETRTDKDERESEVNGIINILKQYRLVDDTNQYLTKSLVKPDEKLILATDFMPRTRDNSQIRMETIFEATEKFVRNRYKKNGLSRDDAEIAFEEIRRGIIKQSLFNKLINFTDEANSNWGLIESPNGSLRLAPKFEYQSATERIRGGNIRRVVNETHEDISDFLLEYSQEDWFREWISSAVLNLDFDKACSEMTRITGVTLNDRERYYYYSEIFEKMHQAVIDAASVDYDSEKVKEQWRNRATFGEKLGRLKRSAQAKVLVKKRHFKRKISDIKHIDHNDNGER